ncbi:MFS transporter [Undibacterium sp. Dicai25W]|uniref:MFS transporter n=1 Tax=Undibacterium sp. Dicai25W TaxID=3413034 RepID=UPI003BF0EF5E
MKKWLVLFSIGIFLFLANLDMTIVNLALPEFSQVFRATMPQIQMVVVSYLTAAAAFFCLFGRLADSIGKRRVFIFGSLLFTLSSLYIGVWAATIEQVIFARFVQGAGFAATLGLALLLIAKAFPQDKKGFATGVAVTVTGVGMALGPPLGGVILQYLDWRWIFLINVPLGLLSITLVILTVDKDDPAEKSKLKLDLPGVPLYLFALGCLIYLSNMVNHISVLKSALVFGLFLIGTFLFVQRSVRVSFPLINVSLMKNVSYLKIILIRMIFNYTMASFLFVLPTLMQNVLNYSKLKSGIWLLAMTFSVAIVAPLAGKVVDTVGYKLPIFVALLLLTFCSLAFSFSGESMPIALFSMGLLCFGVANGILTTSTIAGVNANAPKGQAGTAMGLFFTLVMIGSLFGVSISGLFIDLFSHFKLTQMLGDSIGINTPEFLTLASYANGSHNINELTSTHLNFVSGNLSTLASVSFFSAFRTLMFFNAGLSMLAIALCGSLMLRPQTNFNERSV